MFAKIRPKVDVLLEKVTVFMGRIRPAQSTPVRFHDPGDMGQVPNKILLDIFNSQ